MTKTAVAGGAHNYSDSMLCTMLLEQWNHLNELHIVELTTTTQNYQSTTIKQNKFSINYVSNA
uniref:Uncharacterized protein n=1 Tax=Romanomermis culicivorax TaxID=13658 RepID=A0A915JSU3_ROMCU